MSIFGQVWLWSVVAFFFGALLTWLLLVRPMQARVRALERRLVAAEAPAPARPPAPSTKTFVPEPVEPVPASSLPEVPERVEPESEPEPAWFDRDSWPSATEPERESVLFEPTAAESDGLLPSVLEPDRPSSPEPETTSIFKPYVEPEPPNEAEQTSIFAPVNEPSTEPEPPSVFAPYADPEPEPTSVLDDVPAGTHALKDEEPLPEPDPPQYAFGGDLNAEVSEATQVLPKRQRRESPAGGFDAPKPIQPSMRSIERREPSRLDEGGQSGSLFEPAVRLSPADQALTPPPARRPTSDGAVPPGPFGPGSAMPRPGGGRPSEEFTVKASVTALRYCTEDSAQFPRMVAEVWFRGAADAERVGFRPLT